MFLFLWLTCGLCAAQDMPDAPEPSESTADMDAMDDDPDGELDDEMDDETDDDEPAQVVDSPSLIDQVRKEARTPTNLPTPPLSKYPHVEWHGAFRFRTDLFNEADLGTYEAKSQTEYTATSLFLPPLVKNYTNSSGGATFADKLDGRSEKTIGTANLRLRVDPTVHVSNSLRIGTTVDLLDNIVLGTTPDYLGNVSGGNTYGGFPGAGVPLDTFTRSQMPPSAGVNSLQDSVAVKEAWAEWDIGRDEKSASSFSLGTLKVGRYAYDWGLGIMSSRGDFDRNDTSLTTMQRARALDADWGSYLDRANWNYDFGPMSLMAGFGWLGSGPSSRIATDTSGQPYDIEEKDDLYQVELAFYSRPTTRDDFVQRRKHLFTGKPVVDWGLYVNYRRQSMASTVKSATGVVQYAHLDTAFNDLELVDRDAWLVTPDLFVRLDWRPDPSTRIYGALEAVASVGHVANSDGTAAGQEIDVLLYGAALETNITLGLVSFGLDAGLASGDSTELMELYTGKQKTPWGSDNQLSRYAFNRNYSLDLILYREVLGTVTNSAYLRPHFDFDIIPTEEDAFGGMISALYAFAPDNQAFATDSTNIGLELDAHIFYEESNRFLATAGFGVLIPFAALDRPENYIVDGLSARDAEWSWTLQGNFYLVF